MNGDIVNLHRMWDETVNRLDSLARDVREVKNVMEASRFARWLNFSGLIQLFKDNPSTQKHLEVNAAIVQQKVNDLIYECGELFRGGKADPKYAASDIAEINRKLDLLMERVSEVNETEVLIMTRPKQDRRDHRVSSCPVPSGSVPLVELSDRCG